MTDLTYHFSYREKDRGWQVILSYKDQAGRWKQKSRQGLATKKAAKAAGEKLLADVLDAMKSQPIAPELVDISLAEFAEYVFRSRNLTYNSVLAYRYALKNYGPKLLSMPVRKITYLDIQHAMSAWQCADASYQLYVTCLKMVLSSAVDPYHLRQDNPASRLKPRKLNRRHKIRALTQKEFDRLMENMKDRPIRYYAICAIAGYTGMRLGEIMGLTWSDVDLKERQISVTKQYGRIGHRKRGIMNLKNKAAGHRVIPIPAKLQQILLEYRHVEPRQINGQLFPHKLLHKSLDGYIKKIVPDASIHSLRHTYATMLLAHGTDIKTVAALLGDTVTTVLNVYVDYTDDMRRKAAQSIEKIFA